jgi:hypothetical protein
MPTGDPPRGWLDLAQYIADSGERRFREVYQGRYRAPTRYMTSAPIANADYAGLESRIMGWATTATTVSSDATEPLNIERLDAMIEFINRGEVRIREAAAARNPIARVRAHGWPEQSFTDAEPEDL